MVAKPRRRRWAWIAVAALIVIALGATSLWWFVFRQPAGNSMVRATTTTQPVTLGSVSQTISATGTFKPVSSAELSFPTSGVLTTLKVSVGDKVSKGQSLASIDPTELEAALASAKANLEASQSSLEDTQEDGSSAQIAAAKAEVASNQAKVTAARKDLEDATLTSPIDGVVSEINDLTVGQSTGSSGSGSSNSGAGGGAGSSGSAASSSGSSSAQITVVDTSAWKVEATLAATDVSKVKVGQAVTASIQTSSSSQSGSGGFGGGPPGMGGGGFGSFSFPQGGQNPQSGGGNDSGQADQDAEEPAETISGTVTAIGLVGSSSNGGAASFPLTVTLTGTMDGVYDGTSASLEITTEQLDDVLTVPTAAISTQDGASVVTVVDGDKTTLTKVDVGEVYGDRTQILSGVSGGQMVQVTRMGPSSIPAGGQAGESAGQAGGGDLPFGQGQSGDRARRNG